MKTTHISSKQLAELYQAILQLKNVNECKKFFRDLCTLNELSAMTERWQVAKLIEAGVPYREISVRTGSSTATITRIAHWLQNGKGGYKLILKKLKH
ncbi:MAG: YerC/YecD family TrpR-related protein [Patescibacteria group bacterium]